VTTPRNDDEGEGAPPAKPQRKRRRKKAKAPESDREVLDRLLRSPVTITLSGETKRVPAIEAIVCQLQHQEISGDPRASRILLELRRLTRQHERKKIEIVFVESQNAGSTSTTSTEDEHD
jgi:predicted PilT family ATPase